MCGTSADIRSEATDSGFRRRRRRPARLRRGLDLGRTRRQNSPWPDYTNVFGAVFETLTYAFDGRPVAVVLSGLTIIGLVHLARHPDKFWILGMWAVAAFLFMTAAALPSWRLRAYTVGLFYRDPPRLASLLTVVALPIAVIGLVALWSFLHTRVWPRVTAKLRPDRTRSRPAPRSVRRSFSSCWPIRESPCARA